MTAPQTPTPQDEFLVAEFQAISRFDFNGFADVLHQKDVVLNGTAGDLHVEPDALAQFYNDLSALHTKLRAKMDSLHDRANTAHAQNAGGLLPGAQQAWEAVTQAAGSMKHADSLFGNLLSIDHQVLDYMVKIQQTLEAYTENEGLAVTGLGKAMQVSGPDHSRGPVNAASGGQSANLG